MLKETKKFIEKYKLTERNLSYDYLKRIFHSLGFKIIFFSKFHNKPNVQTLIDTYELHEYIAVRKSFVLVNNFVKLLFLPENNGEEELIHYMLHELGHIWLKHTPNLYSEAVQEREADEFAVYVKVLLKQQKKTLRCILVICAAVIAVSLVYFSQDTPPAVPTYATATPSVSVLPSADIESETVYITTSGKKYHKSDCRYVKNKSNIIEMPKSKAIGLEYEPCKVCKP